MKENRINNYQQNIDSNIEYIGLFKEVGFKLCFKHG